MANISEPKFGCQKCASPNPGDDQLCVDCMRAKLSYMSSVAIGRNGSPALVTPEIHPNDPIAKQISASGNLLQKGVKKFTSPFWLFLFAFVFFFMFSGKHKMMDKFKLEHRQWRPIAAPDSDQKVDAADHPLDGNIRPPPNYRRYGQPAQSAGSAWKTTR